MARQKTDEEIDMAMITDIIFDFFGTLVNYEPDLAGKNFTTSHNYLLSQGFSIGYQTYLDGWAEAFEQLERQAQVDFQEYHMRDSAQRFIANAFQTTVSQPVCDTLVDLFITEWNTGVTYHPDINLFLTELAAHFRLSIITNTHYSPLIDHHLETMGIAHLFCVVMKSVDHGLRKPHPKIFTDTLQMLEISAEQALYIGDSYQNDYQGARNAKLRCILIDGERQYLSLGKERVDHLYNIK